MARFVVTAAVLALTFGSAQAQTTKSPGTDSKPLLENERMRVMEMSFKPGAKTSTLSHPNRFVYALTDGSLVFSPPGKRPYELTFKAGEALWLPAEATATENDGDKEVRALVVEFKEGAHPTKVAAKSKARSKIKARGGNTKVVASKGKKKAGKPAARPAGKKVVTTGSSTIRR
jgi:quercetin dioxygenase-like cupin family protein